MKMKMKILSSIICLFFLISFEINCLKEDEYINSLEELFLNEEFLQEYTQWSLKLFSDPTYLYGNHPKDFPCSTNLTRKSADQLTVHTLRPNDIQCVAALGDSLTAALGAHALTPIGLFTENRGLSWSVGGDYTYETILSLPNILRKYNSQIKGYSTKSSVIFLKGQNSSHNGLNVAKSGDRSYHMIDQVKILHQRFLSNQFCDWKNDWKVITFFIGGNDLCIFCEDLDKHNPLNYTKYVSETLDYLQENFPRTFVNLVLVLDVRGVEKLNAGGNVCKLLHQRTCPCAAFPTDDQRRILDEWIPLYHQNLIQLINTGKYDKHEDFTVVIQPFMAHTPIPIIDGQIDYSYFAPDCFHFSGKGHSRAALSLWNNMLEPVGEKRWEWHIGETIECPTEQRPYFATRFNSRQSLEKLPQIKSKVK